MGEQREGPSISVSLQCKLQAVFLTCLERTLGAAGGIQDPNSVTPYQCVTFPVPEKGVHGVLVVWVMDSSHAHPLLCLSFNTGKASLQNINNPRCPC